MTCLEGDAVWEAADRGSGRADLLDAALARSHTLNPGDIRQNTRDFVPPPGRPTFLAAPVAFLVEYADGFRGTALILNGARRRHDHRRPDRPRPATRSSRPCCTSPPRRAPASSTRWSSGSRTSSGPAAPPTRSSGPC